MQFTGVPQKSLDTMSVGAEMITTRNPAEKDLEKDPSGDSEKRGL